jgi:hypothetical protein
MSSLPLGPTANIDQLEGAALLQGKAHIFTPPDGKAGQRDALPPPPNFVYEGVSDHVSKTHPGQAVLCLKRAIYILRNQENSLCGFDQDCCPAREGAYEANLYRSHDMARGKLFCCSCVYNESVSPLCLLKLGCCQLLQL